MAPDPQRLPSSPFTPLLLRADRSGNALLCRSPLPVVQRSHFFFHDRARCLRYSAALLRSLTKPYCPASPEALEVRRTKRPSLQSD